MNILSEIEGKRGEVLATKLLQVLLLRSQDVRDAVLRLISDRLPSGHFTWRERFDCVVEEPTEDEAEAERGRLDMLIEVDGALVGIEAKIHAPFLDGQPAKCADPLSRRAVALGKLRRAAVQDSLVVLAPCYRENEVNRRLAETEALRDKSAFIAWEDVRAAWKKVPRERLDGTTLVLLDQVDGWLAAQVNRLQGFERVLPHVCGKFEKGGTPAQQRLLWALWPLFGEAGARMSQGDSWAGYYFSRGKSPWDSWFGFVDRSEFARDGVKPVDARPAEFVVITSVYPPAPTTDSLAEAALARPGDWLGGKPRAWIVRFGPEWTSLEKWRSAMRVLLPQPRLPPKGTKA